MIPNPRRVYEDLREIDMLAHHDRTKCGTRNSLGRVISCLACEYAWLHSEAHSASSSSEAKVRVVGADPVGGLVVSKEAMRRDLQRAYKEIDRALKAMRTAEVALSSAQRKVRSQPSAPSQVRYPRTASADDIAKSQEAQSRRRERDEGIA